MAHWYMDLDLTCQSYNKRRIMNYVVIQLAYYEFKKKLQAVKNHGRQPRAYPNFNIAGHQLTPILKLATNVNAQYNNQRVLTILNKFFPKHGHIPMLPYPWQTLGPIWIWHGHVSTACWTIKQQNYFLLFLTRVRYGFDTYPTHVQHCLAQIGSGITLDMYPLDG